MVMESKQGVFSFLLAISATLAIICAKVETSEEGKRNQIRTYKASILPSLACSGLLISSHRTQSFKLLRC
jgi:hypothetical protein